MPSSLSNYTLPTLLVACALGTQALVAQQRDPHIGYVYPAGGQKGKTLEVVVGGQYLDGMTQVLVSGAGVKATVVKINKPIADKRFNELRDYLEEARKKQREAGKPMDLLKGLRSSEKVALTLKEGGATDEEIKLFLLKRKQSNDPKRQQNLQISETVTVKVEIAEDAQNGPHMVRLLKPGGASNPLPFCVSQWPEVVNDYLGDKKEDPEITVPLPSVVNGQILPGAVDRFALQTTRGMHLIVAVQGRDLIPYLADAVPGWFQPAITLYDPSGKKVAFENHFYFSTDPVIYYEVPADGVYHLEIRDLLYRGREDFVYRITMGQIPHVRDIFPLGGQPNFPVTLSVSGWNLPSSQITFSAPPAKGIYPVPELSNGFVTRNVMFAVDDLRQVTEMESNQRGLAQRVPFPVIINGKIDSPGDDDIFGFFCEKGRTVVAEICARRLNSPLDSWLRATDAAGHQVAFNDDYEDKSAGLLTQGADSHLTFTASTSGLYFVHVGDSQGMGGPEYSYRLRISEPMPDFALYIAPSCLNGRASSCVPVTVQAVRKDNFSGDIFLSLKHAPAGCVLDGGKIPAGQDKVRVTITLPSTGTDKPLPLSMEGRADIDGSTIVHPVKPADDMLQAFIYHQLVQADDWIAMISGQGGSPFKITSPKQTLKLKAGGTGRVVVSQSGRPPFIPAETKLQLTDVPEGISVSSITATVDGAAIIFKADETKIKPGLKGNIIAEIFNERTLPAVNGKPAEKRRYSMGFLPAIPYEVTE